MPPAYARNTHHPTQDNADEMSALPRLPRAERQIRCLLWSLLVTKRGSGLCGGVADTGPLLAARPGIGAIIQKTGCSQNLTESPPHKSFRKRSEADRLSLVIHSRNCGSGRPPPDPCDSERCFNSGLELRQAPSGRLTFMVLLLHQILFCPFYSAD